MWYLELVFEFRGMPLLLRVWLSLSNCYFLKTKIERALVALALGTKTLESLEIGFDGETIHPS
jgi:hypothetical protein